MSPTRPYRDLRGSTSARATTSSVRSATRAGGSSRPGRRRSTGLRKARVATRGAARLFEGPSRYLLVVSNNAEMPSRERDVPVRRRARGRGRSLRLGAVNPTADLVLPEGTIPVSGDLQTNWGWLDPANDFRNLGLTPDFPTSAAPGDRMWPHTPVGGGRRGDRRRRPRPRRAAPGDRTRRGRRRDLHRGHDRAAAAQGSVRRVRTPPPNDEIDSARWPRRCSMSLERSRWPVDVLADEMWRAVILRHLMVWSKDPKEAEAWRLAGADGSLDSALARGVGDQPGCEQARSVPRDDVHGVHPAAAGRTHEGLDGDPARQPDARWPAGLRRRTERTGQGGEPLRRRGQRERARRGDRRASEGRRVRDGRRARRPDRGWSPRWSVCRRADPTTLDASFVLRPR